MRTRVFSVFFPRFLFIVFWNYGISKLCWRHTRRSEVLCKKDVLRNFAKFTGKHLYQNLFFNKVAGLEHLRRLILSLYFVFCFTWKIKVLYINSTIYLLKCMCKASILHPFLANVPILYSLKTSEKQRFSGVLMWYKMGTLTRNQSRLKKRD